MRCRECLLHVLGRAEGVGRTADREAHGGDDSKLSDQYQSEVLGSMSPVIPSGILLTRYPSSAPSNCWTVEIWLVLVAAVSRISGMTMIIAFYREAPQDGIIALEASDLRW